MGRYRFAYFDAHIEVFIPDENLVPKLEAPPVPAIRDVYAATRAACSAPIGAPPLRKSVTADTSVLVTIPDKSRRTDIKEVLRAVLDELGQAQISKEGITILIAQGTHRPMHDAEIVQKIGREVAEQYRIVNHAYDDPSCLFHAGKTQEGIPIEFNRLVREHDFIISIGTISAHPVGGYSGGAKGLLPGIAGRHLTDYVHWEATRYPLFEIFGNCENPVRREMEAIVAEVGLDFIVNVTENADREISSIFAGHYIDAHRAGVAFLRGAPLIAFPAEMPDVLILGMGDDRPDFWAGAAGIYAASALLKDGGVIVLFAACPEGVAPEHPVVLEYGYLRWRELEEAVQKGAVLDKTGASHGVTIGKILAQKNMQVMLVSKGIGSAEAERCGFIFYEEPQRAVDAALEVKGRGARILQYARI